jgi:hypothetical protein
MHCTAGDGVGILVGAVLASVFQVTGLADIALEYVLGFGFSWMVFQALFMRDMAGGSYSRSLASTLPSRARIRLTSTNSRKGGNLRHPQDVGVGVAAAGRAESRPSRHCYG